MKYLILLILMIPITTFAKVIDLASTAQVEQELKRPGPAIIMYYTTWCGACAAAKPEFLKASNEMPNVRFYSMDSEKIQLEEHVGLVRFIPYFVIGKDNDSLRNNFCNNQAFSRTVDGFKSEINRCLSR